MRSMLLIGAGAVALTTFGMAVAQPRAGGTVTYWMSADTTSGLPIGAMGQGRGAGNIMSALMSGGGGDGFNRTLNLQLGSPRAAQGAPAAEHLPPAALGAGPSLPLVSPAPTQREPRETDNRWPQDGERPRGRILFYWGCGERAGPGQPYVIDMERIAAGQMPPEFASLDLRTMTPPSASRSTTYGEWPNARSQTRVPPTGSLVGEHVVRGNYTPDIRFTLGQEQDFLAPIQLSANAPTPSGSVNVAWRDVPNARGWFVTAVGGGRDGTVVIWSSSASRFAHMGLIDYLAPDEVARLIGQRVLLPAEARQCTVPAEVGSAVEGAMLNVVAFGPEANFSYPERPANAPRTWAPDWTVKLRTRSAHAGMLGMDMAAMMGGNERARDRRPQQEEPRRRRGLGDRLRDRILGQ